MTRVEEFVDRLGNISIYPKFFHIFDVLMVSVSKALMGELSIEVVAYAVDTWLKKAVRNVRV